jgi:subtilase family serine protease
MRRFVVFLMLAGLPAGLFVGTAGAAPPADTPAASNSQRPVCPGPASPGTVRCHAHVVTDANGAPLVTAGPTGLGPSQVQSAYKLPGLNTSATPTVAIVDAYDDPAAASDLAVFRKQFNLPACGTGCFNKVDQRGGTTYPKANAGWAGEISLDLDAVSSACPTCHILLVETDSNSFANLAAGVDTAARLGASAISNSYGGNEYSGELTDQAHFNHPNIAITASSGDNGYGVEFPAASQYVVAVGGTSLKSATNARGWTETVWSGSGSGCSAYVTKPGWQSDASCSRRSVADVAAVADPYTGLSVYDSVRYQGRAGWQVYGGTSLASPLIASVYALGGNLSAPASYTYANRTALFDVSTGSNGSCGGGYLCTGAAGYDGPTGLGTPNGLTAF